MEVCLYGLIVWLVVGLCICYVYESIVKLLSGKKVDSVPIAQTVTEREQKEKEEAPRLETEQKNEIAAKEKRNKLKLPDVTINNRFVFSNMIVKDKRTGLIWTRDANLGWQNWNNSFKLVKELNQKKYGGYKDWRLPSKKELLTLIAYAKSQNFTDPSGFNGPSKLFNQMGFYDVQHGHIDYMTGYYYWTSNTDTSRSHACVVSMHNGYDYTSYKGENHYVWPVRSGQSDR